MPNIIIKLTDTIEKNHVSFLPKHFKMFRAAVLFLKGYNWKVLCAILHSRMSLQKGQVIKLQVGQEAGRI